jgi:hypothetical protein
MAVIFIPSALAVHDLAFQLDGDTTSTAYSPPPGSNPANDWNDIFNVTENAPVPPATVGTETVSNNSAKVGSGKTFDDAAFTRDFETNATCPTTSGVGLDSTSTNFCTGDDTTYATGSKDTLGIGNGGWQCNHDNNVNSKIDITNAYVAQYTNPANGHKIFYFGVERNVSNGTNDVGVWFLQSGASCSAPSGHLNFTGGHLDGDTLVVAEQTSGGGVSTAKAFRWAASTDVNSPFYGDGGCIDSNDNYDPAVVVNKTHGCNNLPIATGADCKTAGGGSTDSLCATTNAFCPPPRKASDPKPPCNFNWNQSVTTNWLTANGSSVGNTVVSPDFFEGGIDITQAFQGQAGSTPSCFNTVAPDTRSSASPTATLFDFTLNQLGGCGGSLSTQQNFGSASKQIAANGTISSGTDSATLQITGSANWGGTLTWYLCGPDVTTCDANGVNVASETVSNSDGGTSAGTAKSYSTSDVTGNPTGTTGNPTATLTAAGQYCWHAHFEPNNASKTAGIKAQDDDGTNECFTVTPRTPTLTTAAVEPVGLLSPTMCGGLIDLNGDCASNVDPTADNSTAFYGDTNIVGGKLDCNNWASTNDGAAGDGVINSSDNCTLLGWNGSSNVTITVTAGVPNVTDGTALPAIFPNPATPSDHSVSGSSFAWSDLHGRVDTNGSGTITADDCSNNVVNSYAVLGANCGNSVPYGNGLVDLNGDGAITPADSCTTGCFLGHNVSSGFVVAGQVLFGGTIEDVALLTGTARNPDPLNQGPNLTYPTINGGTQPADTSIIWTLHGPGTGGAGDCSATTLIASAPTPSSIQVAGDGTYGPVSYTTNHATDKVGKYDFAASYAGEGPNTNPATGVSCDTTGGNGEQVTVIGSATSSTAQRWLPNDRVVLASTAGTVLKGTLTVTLYKGTHGGTLANCSAGTATAVTNQSYTQIVDQTNATPTNSFTYNTTNTTFVVGTNSDGTTTGAGTDGDYFWLIQFAATGITSPNDRCEIATISHNDG